MASTKKHSRPISPTRRWVFRLLAMTLVPISFLFFLEFSLYLFGFGQNTDFFIPATQRSALITNDKFSWRIFPKQMAIEPIMQSINTPKPSDTIRVVVLGASAAQGYPESDFSFPRILQAMLNERYPQHNFQVINTGVTAINSHAVRLIAQDAIALEPDIFVVYLGNNEIVGPFGPGTVFANFTPSLSYIHLNLYLKSTRIGQLIDHLAKPPTTNTDDAQKFQGMKMFTEHRVAANDTRLPAVYQHFAANLKDIAALGQNANAKVILSTVPVNLRDHAPFSSEHRPNFSATDQSTWDQLFESANAAASNKDHPRAANLYQQALALDDQHAELHFRLAQSFEKLNIIPDAQEHYRLARDLDTLRFRADTRINTTIKNTAAALPNVTLVDAEGIFQNTPQAVNAIPGAEHFYEHVHLNFEGNYLLAASIFPAVVENLPASIHQTSATQTTPPSLQTCAQAVGYTPWDHRRIANTIATLTAQPPFTLQFNHAAQQQARRTAALQIPYSYPITKDSAQARRLAMEANTDDLNLQIQLAFILYDLGQYDQTVTLLEQALEQFPEFKQLAIRLQEVKAAQLKFNTEREPHLLAAKHEPTNFNHPNRLGMLFQQHKRFDESINYYRKALSLKPDDPGLHYNLAVTFLAAQYEPQALTSFRRALNRNPDFYQAHYQLANALQQLGRLEDSLNHYQQTLRLVPSHYLAHRNYALALRALNRLDQAITHLQTAIQLKPDYTQAQHDLQSTLIIKNTTNP